MSEYIECLRLYDEVLSEEHHENAELYQPFPYDLGRMVSHLTNRGDARAALINHVKGKFARKSATQSL
jgi:hypothetical protein